MLKANCEQLNHELQNLYDEFYEGGGDDVEFSLAQNDLLKFTITSNDKTFEYEYATPQGDDLKIKSLVKRYALQSLYKALSEISGKALPWGSFTGIRPTALARGLIESGEVKDYAVREKLESDFSFSHEKALLCVKILKNQNTIIKNDHLIDFYVNIPVCPTRCAYCSFISSELKDVKKIMGDYLNALITEIRAMKSLMKDKSLIARSIYVGGGTPTVLEASELDRLLSELSFKVSEFTVECGRPDTITREKLEFLKKHGVTRICINPQTFNDATLKKIGRAHTSKAVYEAYSLALEYGFKMNMDIILGLQGEGKKEVEKTISTLLELCPNNITIHTLSLKRGSELIKAPSLKTKNLAKILSQSEEKLMQNGYKPYYLYRQKHQNGLENVGFYRDNDICLFNVDSMEESASIIAVGANAITKRVFSIENRIEREPNCKFIPDYISRLDEMIARKQKLFEKM